MRKFLKASAWMGHLGTMLNAGFVSVSEGGGDASVCISSSWTMGNADVADLGITLTY